MEEVRDWFNEMKMTETMENLRDNDFEVITCSSSEEAKEEILDLINEDSLIGVGGSVTIRELNILEELKSRDVEVADHWKAHEKGKSAEEVRKIREKHLNSDVFLTSTNALTKTGKLVNIDGTGQRVAAMIYGPEKVILPVGINKICDDLHEGVDRARNIAAPMNAKRLDLDTPCVETGECEDCESEDRICKVTTILDRRPHDTEITIVLIDETLGY